MILICLTSFCSFSVRVGINTSFMSMREKKNEISKVAKKIKIKNNLRSKRKTIMMMK